MLRLKEKNLMQSVDVFSDHHVPGDSEIPADFSMDGNRRIYPGVFRTFESDDGTSFRIQIEVRYTISYNPPIECESGMVTGATGLAQVDDDGLLFLTDATITFTEKGKQPNEGYLFAVGFIPGMKITDMKSRSIFSYQPEEPIYTGVSKSVSQRVVAPT